MASGRQVPAPAAIHRVAIIGAGSGGPLSGAALALLCGQAGFAVTLEDVLPGNLRRAAASMEAAGVQWSPRYAGSIEDAVRDADLVIDTVPDELESKLEILTLLDRMAPPGALLATPIEHLSIADLASCTYRPGQCFGLRFLSTHPLAIALSYAPGIDPTVLERMLLFLGKTGAEVEEAVDLRALP